MFQSGSGLHGPWVMKADEKKEVTAKDSSTDQPTLPRREAALYASGIPQKQQSNVVMSKVP